MNAEFFAAIEDIEKEKGIPREYMYDKIRQAMLAAFRRDHPENEDNVEIILDEDKKRIDMQVNKLVVERLRRLPAVQSSAIRLPFPWKPRSSGALPHRQRSR